MAEHYGEAVNAALLDFIGPLRGTVLDLGCGVGEWAARLRGSGAERLLGVEPSADAAVAAGRYDEVYQMPVEALGDTPPVDVVIAADVLEHLVDPWQVLRALRARVSAGGALIVSVPNIQRLQALLVMAGGRFAYEDGGFWDRTHLHWFTLQSLEESLVEAGWLPQAHRFVLGEGRRAQLSRWTGGRWDRFLGHQLHLRAVAG
ncbi:MAG TPA: class I SAM-dependent methyltransferase [Actinomycetota bacterium]|nr:class I SAM-dependent methyltransferase [Actinomycetota bacterium]